MCLCSPSSINWYRPGKVTVGLASHWPCVTDSVVYPPMDSMTWEREMSLSLNSIRSSTAFKHIICHIGGRFYRSDDPTNSVKALKDNSMFGMFLSRLSLFSLLFIFSSVSSLIYTVLCELRLIIVVCKMI